MDARVRYTKKVIKEAFLRILKEKPMEHITVTEICTKADINRATFYKYYSNPSDLLEQLEKEQMEKLNARIKTFESTSSETVCRALLYDFKENKDFYQVTLDQNGNDEFRNRIYELCAMGSRELIAEYFPQLSAQKQEWLHLFLVSGFKSVLQNWQESSMTEDIEEITSFLNSISYQVMHSPLK